MSSPASDGWKVTGVLSSAPVFQGRTLGTVAHQVQVHGIPHQGACPDDDVEPLAFTVVAKIEGLEDIPFLFRGPHTGMESRCRPLLTVLARCGAARPQGLRALRHRDHQVGDGAG